MEVWLAGGWGLGLTAIFLISGFIGLDHYAERHSENPPE